MENTITIQNLKNTGYRITKLRKAIFEILNFSKKPLSVPEIIKEIYKRDLSVNKTTVYRELKFLINANLVNEVDFGDGKKRYEIDEGRHHHHAVCVNCGAVEDIELKIDLSLDEKKIENETGFKVSQHTIELFGLCQKCQH